MRFCFSEIGFFLILLSLPLTLLGFTEGFWLLVVAAVSAGVGIMFSVSRRSQVSRTTTADEAAIFFSIVLIAALLGGTRGLIYFVLSFLIASIILGVLCLLALALLKK